MATVLNCDCGFAARAADEEGLVAEVRRHAWDAHGMPLTLDEAAALAARARIDGPADGSEAVRDGEAKR